MPRSWTISRRASSPPMWAWRRPRAFSRICAGASRARSSATWRPCSRALSKAMVDILKPVERAAGRRPRHQALRHSGGGHQRRGQDHHHRQTGAPAARRGPQRHARRGRYFSRRGARAADDLGGAQSRADHRPAIGGGTRRGDLRRPAGRARAAHRRADRGYRRAAPHPDSSHGRAQEGQARAGAPRSGRAARGAARSSTAPSARMRSRRPRNSTRGSGSRGSSSPSSTAPPRAAWCSPSRRSWAFPSASSALARTPRISAFSTPRSSSSALLKTGATRTRCGRRAVRMIRFDQVHKRYPNGREALAGVSFRHRGRRARVPHRPFRCGQEQHLEADRAHRAPDARAGVHQQSEHRRHQGARHPRNFAAAHRRGVPGSQAAASTGRSPTTSRCRSSSRAFRGVRSTSACARRSTRSGSSARRRAARSSSRPASSSGSASPAPSSQSRTLLIADEPTGNLDPDLALEIMQLFKRFNDVGVTVVIATHDMHLIDRLAAGASCSRTAAWYEGRPPSVARPPCPDTAGLARPYRRSIRSRPP